MREKMTVTIPAQLLNELKLLSNQEGRSLSNFVSFLLQKSLDEIKNYGRPSLVKRINKNMG